MVLIRLWFQYTEPAARRPEAKVQEDAGPWSRLDAVDSSVLFTVVEGFAAGVPRGVLDGPRFRRAFHGVRVPIALPDTVAVRAAAAAL